VEQDRVLPVPRHFFGRAGRSLGGVEIDTSEVERTARMDPEVKHARNRPLGQKNILVIRCTRRWRQCTSVRVREAVDMMTTKWSDVTS